MFMIALQTLETMSSPSWFRRREGEFSTGHMGCWLFSCILQSWLTPFDNTTLHTRRSTGYPVVIKRRNGKSPSFSYHIRYSIFRHTREPSSAPVSFHWQVLRRSMIEARKKGLGQNLGVYDSVAHVWIHDDLRLPQKRMKRILTRSSHNYWKRQWLHRTLWRHWNDDLYMKHS